MLWCVVMTSAYVFSWVLFRSRDFYHTCYCLSGLSVCQHFPTEAPHDNDNDEDSVILVICFFCIFIPVAMAFCHHDYCIVSPYYVCCHECCVMSLWPLHCVTLCVHARMITILYRGRHIQPTTSEWRECRELWDISVNCPRPPSYPLMISVTTVTNTTHQLSNNTHYKFCL